MKPLTADMGRPAAPIRCELDGCEFWVREATHLENVQFNASLVALPEDMDETTKGVHMVANRIMIHVVDANGEHIYQNIEPLELAAQLGARFFSALYDKTISTLDGILSVGGAEKD